MKTQIEYLSSANNYTRTITVPHIIIENRNLRCNNETRITSIIITISEDKKF